MVRLTKTIAVKRLGNVPEGKQFFCGDGRVLKNLPELEIALREMSEATFSHHSNQTKNDFSKWVREVIGDDELSIDLLKSATRIQAAKRVADRIAWLRSKI